MSFVDAMTKLEVDYNVSKIAVERMRKEMFHLTQRLHSETVKIVEQRLGRYYVHVHKIERPKLERHKIERYKLERHKVERDTS